MRSSRRRCAASKMPSKSKKQARFMAAVAHSRKFAKKAGVPQSIGKEFNRADKRKRKAKDSAMSKFAADEIKHDPSSGQFAAGGGGAGSVGRHAVMADAHHEQATRHAAVGEHDKAKLHKQASVAHMKASAARTRENANHRDDDPLKVGAMADQAEARAHRATGKAGPFAEHIAKRLMR